MHVGKIAYPEWLALAGSLSFYWLVEAVLVTIAVLSLYLVVLIVGLSLCEAFIQMQNDKSFLEGFVLGLLYWRLLFFKFQSIFV